MPELAQLVEGVVQQRFPLEREVVRIGRGPSNDIQLDDSTVSSAHALIQRKPNDYMEGVDDYFLVDLESTNRTFVNGEAISRHLLVHDDQIRIGWATFKFIDETAAPPEETAYILPRE